MYFNKILNKAYEQGMLIEPAHIFKQVKKIDNYTLYQSSDVSININLKGDFGKDNIILCGENCKINGGRILIKGTGNIVVIGANSSLNGADIRITGNNNIFYFGAFSTVGSMIVMLSGDERSVLIGDYCMLSNRIMIDVSDHHAIYDINTGKRQNFDKDVNIGNHVWINRDVKINKGVSIDSNVVVEQGAIVNGKLLANTLYGGVPVRPIQSDITWSRMKASSYSEMSSSKRNQEYTLKVEAFKKKIDLLHLKEKDISYDLQYDQYISLGYDCEVGLQLRRWGYEESSFFRFTLCRLPALKKILNSKFNNVFQYENLIPGNDNMVRDTKYNIAFHTGMKSKVIDGKRVFIQNSDDRFEYYKTESNKVQHLIEKMKSEIHTGKRILFFLKTDEILEYKIINELVIALEKFGFTNFNIVYLALNSWNINWENEKIFIERLTNYTEEGKRGTDADIHGYNNIFKKYGIPIKNI